MSVLEKIELFIKRKKLGSYAAQEPFNTRLCQRS